MKALKLTLFILIVSIGVKAQSMNYWIPFNLQANYIKSLNLPVGSTSDSLIVMGSGGWLARIAPIPQNYIVNTTSVGLSKSTLNSTYPSVAIGYMVLCPSITLGGAVYIKSTENGSSDVWQLISAPPVL